MNTKQAASHENLAPGVRIGCEGRSGIKYIGSEQSLIDSGLAQPEWFAGLLGYQRRIAKTPSGDFTVIGNGKGNRLTNEHKEYGAYSIGRNRDGSYSVFVYHHPDEYRIKKALFDAQRKARHEAWRAELAATEHQKAWLKAKEAHAAKDFPNRWKNGVLFLVDQIESLVTSGAVFTDFPDVGLPAAEIAAVSAAADKLRSVLQSCKPEIKDRVHLSNVVSINARAYRNMRHG